MYYFKKKNSKNFFPEGPRENVWGPARTFPQAPLWLSTGLYVSSSGVISVNRCGSQWSLGVSVCVTCCFCGRNTVSKVQFAGKKLKLWILGGSVDLSSLFP